MKTTEANYKEQPVEEFSNNPLIEALPLLMTKEQRSSLFIKRNQISPKERELSNELRISKLANISKLFVPTNWGTSLALTIELLIREGYRRRNPLNYDDVRTAYDIAISSFNDLPDLKDPVGSVFLVGCSGIGKTTTIQSILSHYPQVIKHEEYCTIPLNRFQVVYLYINVPNDGSIKGFCVELLNAFDNALGTNYVESNKRSSVSVLSNLVARLCTMYSVGIVIIDESQNLLNSNYGANRLTEFLNNLSNKIGCPLCIVGTPKSQELMNGTFHLCRRFEGRGSKTLKPYSKESPDWRTFINILWSDGLYLNGPNELTPEIYDAIHHYSTGIPAIAKDLFYEIQYVILDNPGMKEEITEELIRNVALEHFPNIENNIEAIRNNDFGRINEMGDWTTKTGFKPPKQKQKIRKGGNKNRKHIDTIEFYLNQLGYTEFFSKEELKEQAQAIALKVEPETSKDKCIPVIINYMNHLIKKRIREQEREPVEQDLEENIIHVDELF